jgi:hypothetical protein
MTENILVRHAKTAKTIICKVQSPSKVLVFRLFSTPYGRLSTRGDAQFFSFNQTLLQVSSGGLCLESSASAQLFGGVCWSGGFLTWPVPPKHHFYIIIYIYIFWIFHDQPQSPLKWGTPIKGDTSIWPSSLLWFTCEAPEAEWWCGSAIPLGRLSNLWHPRWFAWRQSLKIRVSERCCLKGL